MRGVVIVVAAAGVFLASPAARAASRSGDPACLTMDEAPPAPAAPPAREEACTGERSFDPSCWPDDPASSPGRGSLARLFGSDLLVATMATPPPAAPSGRAAVPRDDTREHPGYARGLERPPRLASR